MRVTKQRAEFTQGTNEDPSNDDQIWDDNTVDHENYFKTDQIVPPFIKYTSFKTNSVKISNLFCTILFRINIYINFYLNRGVIFLIRFKHTFLFLEAELLYESHCPFKVCKLQFLLYAASLDLSLRSWSIKLRSFHPFSLTASLSSKTLLLIPLPPSSPIFDVLKFLLLFFNTLVTQVYRSYGRFVLVLFRLCLVLRSPPSAALFPFAELDIGEYGAHRPLCLQLTTPTQLFLRVLEQGVEVWKRKLIMVACPS